MMSECSDIFRRYTGHLTVAIEEPSLIAADLLQNGVIVEASKSKAELNTIVPHQRSSELLSAVSRSIRGDFCPPKMFLGTIAALKKHSDTREIAIRMELEYYGHDTEQIDNDIPNGDNDNCPKRNVLRTEPSCNSTRNVPQQEEVTVCPSTVFLNNDSPQQSQQLSSDPPLVVSAGLISLNVPAPVVYRFLENHPHIIQFFCATAVIAIGYFAYKKWIK